MAFPSSDSSQDAVPERRVAILFRGSRALCHEYSLVLEATAIEHDLSESGGSWLLTVSPHLLQSAYDQISRYAAERRPPRSVARPSAPFPGASFGTIGYVIILLLIAYCTGIGLFGANWLEAGDLDVAAPREWWRAITALTLHLDQEHLLGNLLFGAVAGMAAGRLLGPGLAWASILAAGAIANYVDILVAPAMHRAVGASTAVFAALGLLTGLAWRQRLSLAERRWYRWAPLIAGICLLTLLGAGSAHVDVLGHALGFVFGTGVGWLYAREGIPRNRTMRPQLAAAAGALLLVGIAWLLALRHAV